MIIFKSADGLTDYLAKHSSHKTSGFVPTMGALHEGHLSLIQRAKSENDITICSIFINPSQFTNEGDFKKYPVTIERDIELLLSASCDILFLPPASEIYPAGYKIRTYPLGRIETIWEGHYRPGHFQGVCQVVERLLQIVAPQKIYLGQKDYQQCMVIRKLITLLGKEHEVEVVICPTVRAENGLAMSSRNLRLSEDEREKASCIYKALLSFKEDASRPYEELTSIAKQNLQANGFIVDYIAIADAVTLEPAHQSSQKRIGIIAATISSVRLIDNMQLN